MTMPPPLGPLTGCQSYATACRSVRTALPKEIDVLGHVNNAVYVRWIQDAAVGHWSAVAGDGVPETLIWVCSRHEIDYKDQVREGDTVEIRTWLGPRKGARFARHTDIRCTGAAKPAVEALTWWVLLDRESGRPKRVDSAILKLFGLA
ncbi:MAG: acyl-CoA thioesterase [Pseudomonadota bacterium]